MSHWTIDSARTLDLDDVSELRVSVVGGRLDVITSPEPVTRLEVTDIDSIPLEISLESGVLVVRHGTDNWGSWLKRIGTRNQRITLSIAVPPDTTVHAATVNGDALISGMRASTDLHTVSGSVMSDATAGTMSVNTVSGEVVVRNHQGPLTAKSVSGEVTASGDLHTISAKTVSGDLAFDLNGHPAEAQITGVSGDMTLRLPAEVGVDLQAKTVSGKVILDDLRFSGSAQTIEAGSGPQEGRFRLKASTVSGDLSIVHQRESYVQGGIR
ncbi:DUF4097 family beta strand repeat-containing protein [Psychromicrobium xiongbiense]|uniref:DUF4097 family beta strand repeat-containing protein n=1 Tax=Psychromicrobium xiongbiense TaxID=3051184 RepID=UPI002557807D|nr:DUF4097 family beta strand repeat-containing protein [Psychromicrobium sp. YIM S02556]